MPTQSSPALCPRCGRANACAVAAGRDPQSCWCFAAPPLAATDNDPLRCYCVACLRELQALDNGRRDRDLHGDLQK